MSARYRRTYEFESDLVSMIKSIQFRTVRNNFLAKLKNYIKEINNTDELLVNADKSTNIYKFSKDQYKKHLCDNVTKTYKKSNRNKVNNTNYEAKTLCEKLNIDDRLQQMQETEAFITVKDHKEGFPHTLSFRLINPSKSDIGKISKSILDKINKAIVSTTSVNHWKNTSDVIKWFKSSPGKRVPSFVNFDVENFYPSISVKLFTDSTKYAKNLIEITDQDLAITIKARKTLLFQNTESWIKKSGTEDFDVPMGCYDGAEVCELVGSYMLNQLKHDVSKESIGLYRDDGLGVFHNIPKPEIERQKKQIAKRFKECGLSITIQCNLK